VTDANTDAATGAETDRGGTDGDPETENGDGVVDANPGVCVGDPVTGTRTRTDPGTFRPFEGDGVPDFVEARDHVRESLVRFVRSLRRAGAEVPANAAPEATRALIESGFGKPAARAGLRATMITRREDIDVFDRQFPEFWRRLTAGLDGTGPQPRREDGPDGHLAPLDGSSAPGEQPETEHPGDPDDGHDSDGTETTTIAWVDGGDAGEEDEDEDDEDDEDETVTASTYSRTGVPAPLSVPRAALRDKDALAGPMNRLTRAIAGLDGRRWTPDGDRRIDTRRALRESFGTGGIVLEVPRRTRKHTAVRATLVVDVSQSVLDTVDRGFLLDFLHRAVAAWRDVRVFFFDEGVREVTDAFDCPTTADAVAALERAETEWGGGTRIGDAVARLRREFPDAVDRNTVAVVMSDGLETGDVEALRTNAAWLSRRARTILWCNPLAASPDYEPATRGMEAALPYLDGLFAFAGPDDVAEMARQLRLHGTGGSIGYEHDPRRRAGAGNDTQKDAHDRERHNL